MNVEIHEGMTLSDHFPNTKLSYTVADQGFSKGVGAPTPEASTTTYYLAWKEFGLGRP